MRALLPAILLFAIVAAAPAVAQQDQPRRSTQQTMGERSYQRLEQAHELLAEERYEEVIARLESMESMRLNDYEQALVYQTYGFVYAGQDRYEQAVEYFERCLALNALPDQGQQGMLYSLAGLYASLGRYEQTIATLERWLPGEAEPTGDAFIMLAVAYAELKRFDEALPWVEKAIASAEEPGRSWYELLVSILFDTGDYARAAAALETMVASWPRQLGYWQMLSGCYQELGNDVKAASAMGLAYHNGLLTGERELLNLARMQLYINDAYAAGRLLEREIASRRIPSTEATLALLLAAWTQAREFDKSIETIGRLAELTDDGNYHLAGAQLFAEKTEWEQVIASADRAIETGGLDEPGQAWMLKGVAQTELGRLQAARSSLEQAQRIGDADLRRQAAGWLSLVRDRMALEEPQASGEQASASGAP